MPHAGLMNERAMGPEKGPFQRARLHIRGGRRRLREGKIAAGIVTLYDAVCAAFEWYVASPDRTHGLVIHADDDLRDDKAVYRVLVRSGVLDGAFDYGDFLEVVDMALYRNLDGYEYGGLMKEIESVMTSLGIMPFDENELPREDPSTF